MNTEQDHDDLDGRFKTYARILKSLGRPLQPRDRILDFGCGAGELVKAAYQSRCDAYGCDIDFSSEWIDQGVLAEMRANGRVRKINCDSVGKASPSAGSAYRIPFDDSTFDVVISDQVFEHVQNYDQVIGELHRVMKPRGVMLHIFPSRYRLIEPHIFVPLASVLRARRWLRLWATLGIRNQYQKGLSINDTVDQNAEFLQTMTNYRTGEELKRAFGLRFDVRNAESQFMAQSKRARLFLVPSLYRTFHSRVLYGMKL